MSRTTLKSEATAPGIRKVPFVRAAIRVAMVAAFLGLGGLSLSQVRAQEKHSPEQVGGPIDKRIDGTGPVSGSGPAVELHNQAGPDGDVHGKTKAVESTTPAATHEDTTTAHDDEAKVDPAHKAEADKHDEEADHGKTGEAAHDDHGAAGHTESAHGGGEHKEAPFSIHLPTWITGLLKNFFWHKGPAEVVLKGAVGPDGQAIPAQSLVGQTITFDYEDPHHPGHPERVTGKITEVGNSTDAEHATTVDVNGQSVHLVHPEVKWTLEKMFPEAIIISWLIAITIVLVLMWMVRDLRRVPSGKQGLAEIIYEALDNFVHQLIGPTYKKYVPLIIAAFVYIFCMNVAGLIPGWASPTANINVTAGMAIVVMIYVQYEGIRANGVVGYFKHFVGEPVWLFPLNFPLHIIGEFAKLLSLTIRLFGNIFGEDVVIVILLYLAVKFTQGWVPVHVLMYFFGVFTSFVQAMVFSILTCVYIAMMTVHEDHGHGHGHEQNDHNHGHGHEVAHAH